MGSFRLPILLSLLLLLGACAGTQDITKNWSPERFYQEAQSALKRGSYQTAIKYFQDLDARYPYGPYAVQAELEIGYAYLKNDEPAMAIAAADRFIRLHPTHPHVDYAYYLKGLADFSGKQNFFRKLVVGNDIAERDQKSIRDAYETFRQLVQRYPDSRYAPDARQRMIYLYNVLADHEIDVARFYYNHHAYVAAVNRCKDVIESYPRSMATEAALGIQAMAYKRMGLVHLAEATVQVLEKNFPKSHYLGEIAAIEAPPLSTAPAQPAG